MNCQHLLLSCSRRHHAADETANQYFSEACPRDHAVQGASSNSSAEDCARMLKEIPQVPQSLDEFQQYLWTGTVALTPSYHSRLVFENPSLQGSVFAAASEGSFLARDMDALVRDYGSAAGTCTFWVLGYI